MSELGGGGVSPSVPIIADSGAPRPLQGAARAVWVLRHLSTSCHSLRALGEKLWESEAFSGPLPSEWEERPSSPPAPVDQEAPRPPQPLFGPFPGRKVSLCACTCLLVPYQPASPVVQATSSSMQLGLGMRVSLPSLEQGSQALPSSASLHRITSSEAPGHSA